MRLPGARGRALVVLLLSAAGLSWACTSSRGIPAPEGGGTVVSSDAALSLQRRADGFYLRLARRRFNTLETYNDFILRDYFRTPDLFFDYYADLAQALDDAHFERSRPMFVEVQEFLFEGEQTVQVQVLFRGWDDRPLNPFRTSLIRIDRWEKAEGRWWIRPGKL